MNIIDILLHIRNQLGPDDRHTVEKELREVDGIIAPRFSENNDQLLVVAYNPAKVNSGGLMEKITSMGLEARLVGL